MQLFIQELRYKHQQLTEWLCRKLCGNHLFNSDMSLEIDRLTVENESLKKKLQEAKNER